MIEAVGECVRDREIGQRVLVGLDAPRRALGGEGTYQTHYLVEAEKTVPAPDALPEEQLGAIWLAYLTAWGCLVWKQRIERGGFALVPAASSAVAIAASQILRERGCTVIGTTRAHEKAEKLRGMDEAQYDHLIVTRDNPEWWREVKQITDGQNCDAIFDPVAAGEFLNSEIRLLAQHGTLWVYGLLGEPGEVDVAPLIRKHAAIRGWSVFELATAGGEALWAGYRHVLDRLADGRYKLPVAETFPLDHAADAHRTMERAEHLGKLILIP